MVLPMSTFAVAVGAWSIQDLSFHYTESHIPIRSVGQVYIDTWTLFDIDISQLTINNGQWTKNWTWKRDKRQHETWDKEHGT